MFFLKSFILRDNVEEYCRDEVAIDDVVTCPLHAAYVSLQARTQNMQYVLLFHYNNCCTNAPQITLYAHCLSRWSSVNCCQSVNWQQFGEQSFDS